MPFTKIDAANLGGTTLPALNGSALTNISAGKINQVINAQYGYAVTNSTSFVDTGLTASITPSATDSKVLVLCSLVGCYTTGANTCLISRLVRGSTEILQTESIGGYTGNTNEIGYGGSSAASYLDSPSTTSATTYKIQFATRVSDNVSIGNWQQGSERGKSTITLIEVLA